MFTDQLSLLRLMVDALSCPTRVVAEQALLEKKCFTSYSCMDTVLVLKTSSTD